MTHEEIALRILEPILKDLRDQNKDAAVAGGLDEAGDHERRLAAQSIKLIDEIENEIRQKAGYDQ